MNKEELLAFFFAEVEEQIESLEQDILRLESHHEDKEIIQSIFRNAHSIKGSSASMGFDKLKAVTHQMEYVLDSIRKEKLVAHPSVVDALFECLDVLRDLKDHYQNGTGAPETEPIIQKLKELLDKQETKTAAEPAPPSSPSPSLSPSPSFKPDIPETVLQAIEAQKDIWAGEVTFSESCATKTLRAHLVKKEAEKWGTLLHADLSHVEEPSIRKVWFYVDKANEEPDAVSERIRKIMDVEDVAFLQVTVPEEKTAKKAEKTIKKPTASPTIRVDVSKIETLMNLVGEIIIDQTMVMQLNQDMKQGIANGDVNGDDLTEQERVLKHMARVVSEFQENIMKTRMLPIENLYSRFPRIVRDTSNQLQKDIELILEGGETEIDRTVIEEITDPMIHIIRNSLDHGIEPNDVRKQKGKGRGTVHITASHKENQVVLTIRDDGAGIDPEKIKASALKKGVITEQEAKQMTDKEIVHLVFHPGFSTAEQVSDVSGRGVGMDVVRTHIEKLNGLIEIDTEKDKGTTMTIKLPLTLAIMKGFLVNIENRTFTIPMNSVTEIVQIKPQDIQSVGGEEMVKLRDKTIPLVRAHDILGFERQTENDEDVVVMLIGIAEKRIGLVVDRLIGNQEIVIKPLGSYIGNIRGISGSAILGDGQVSLILDVTGIFALYAERKGGVRA